MSRMKAKDSVCVHIEEHITHDYHSGEQYGDWETHYENTPTHLSKEAQGYSYEEIPVQFEVDTSRKYWYVGIDYSSGDSFGRSQGNHMPAAVFETYEEAVEFKDGFLEHVEKTSDRASTWDEQVHFLFKGTTYYIGACMGYFEHVEGVRIIELGFYPSKQTFTVH